MWCSREREQPRLDPTVVWLASSGVPPGLGAPNSRGVFSSPSNSAGSWTIRPPPSTRRALTLACPHTVLPGLYYARSPAPCLAHPLRRGTLAVGLQPPAVPPPRRPQCPASGNAVETLETAELAPLCIISSLSPTPGLGPPPECRCGCGCEGVFPPPPLGRCRTRTRTRRPRTRPDSQTCVQQPAALGRSPASGYYESTTRAGPPGAVLVETVYAPSPCPNPQRRCQPNPCSHFPTLSCFL